MKNIITYNDFINEETEFKDLVYTRINKKTVVDIINTKFGGYENFIDYIEVYRGVSIKKIIINYNEIYKII